MSLEPSEKISMCNGRYIPIKDIHVGEEVLCFNPDTMITSKTKVIGQFVQPIANNMTTYRIKTCSNRTIVATKDHKFITEEGWKTVSQIWEENKKQKVVRIGIRMKNFNIDEVDLKTISQQVDETTAIDIIDIIKVFNWYMTHIDLVDPKGKTDLLFKIVENMRFTHCVDTNKPNIYRVIYSPDEYISIDDIKCFNDWLNCVVVIKGDFMFVPILSIVMEPQHTFVSCINVESNNNNFITHSRFGTGN